MPTDLPPVDGEPPVTAVSPLSLIDAVPERGVNLGYMIAAATGGIVPGFVLRGYGAVEDDRLACRAIGRRIWLSVEEQAAGMGFAAAYWGVIRTVSLTVFLVPLVVLGIVDHTVLGGPVRFVLAVALGACFTAVVETSFAAMRMRY